MTIQSKISFMKKQDENYVKSKTEFKETRKIAMSRKRKISEKAKSGFTGTKAKKKVQHRKPSKLYDLKKSKFNKSKPKRKTQQLKQKETPEILLAFQFYTTEKSTLEYDFQFQSENPLPKRKRSMNTFHFNLQNKESILERLSSNSLSVGDEININEFITSILKCNQKSPKSGVTNIYNELLCYLNDFSVHVASSSIAVKISEACLYTVYKINQISQYKLPDEIYFKYFNDKVPIDLKLYATVAHCGSEKYNFDKQTHIVLFLLETLENFFDQNGRVNVEKKFLKFDFEEIVNCLEIELKHLISFLD